MTKESIDRWLQRGEKYGLSVVFCAVFLWGGSVVCQRLYDDFVIPIRDSSQKLQEKTGEAIVKTAESLQVISDVVKQSQRTTDDLERQAAEHIELTKKTAASVERIEKAVVPKTE